MIRTASYADGSVTQNYEKEEKQWKSMKFQRQ